MGCTNSNPRAQDTAKKPGSKGIYHQNIKYKDLTELDELRIKFILDYWYDHANITNQINYDGEQDGETINEFHQRMQ